MIAGHYCKRWMTATHGMLHGVPLSAPHTLHCVKVMRIEGENVHCAGDGESFQLRIERRQDGVEYAALTINDPLCGPLNFHAYPFRAETFRG